MADLDLDLKAMKLLNNGISLPADDEPLPRQFGRLTLLKRLARGGMGEVFLAATRGIEGAERPCVVKAIRPEHLEDKSFRARFLDETRIQAQLQHPGVAQILEASTTTDGSPYAVVEYIEGRHLGEVLARSNQLGVRIGWADAVAIGICFGDALAHVHERTDPSGRPLQIAHRDLSPQNVMVGYSGDLKLIDFGTARGENRRCRTVAGIVFAKPGYVAPEVANQTPGGPQADLYAFGVMVWELIAGHRFLQGDAVEHQARVARGDGRLPPLAKDVGAPERLDRILAELTAPSLATRYPSARRAVADLAELLKAAPSLADGDRSVRGRISQLMQLLYPAEPARSRADFSRRVAQATKVAQEAAESTRAGIPEPSPAPPAAEEPDPGLLVGTRYRLTRCLSQGGMGEVWEAVHVDLGRVVALKLIPEAASRSPEARARFKSEARAVARLDHPGVVNVHDFGIAGDGRFYYVMELLSGATLAERLKEGPLHWRLAVRVAMDAANALGAAHLAGLLHRDITPANLFVTADGRVKLIDFGVARHIESVEEAGGDAPLVVGTPEYVSPEQAAGAPADSRSDLYALGVVLYEALTGRVPHPLGPDGSPSLPALLTAKITRTAPAPSFVLGAAVIPRSLDRVVMRMLDRDPSKRPDSASALVSELEAVLATPTAKRPKREIIVGAAALALGTIGLVAFAGGSGEATARPQVDLAALRETPASTTDAATLAATADEVIDVDAIDMQGTEASGMEPALVAPKAQSAVEVRVEHLLGLFRRGRKTEAHHEMKLLAAKHPEDARVAEGLVTTAPSVGAWGEALGAARRWNRLEPSARSVVAVARLERATLSGDPVATLHAASARYPGDADIEKLLATCLDERAERLARR